MLMWGSSLSAQVNAEAWLDTNAILVGDQVNLYLRITQPKDIRVKWPVLNDTITGDIEILEKKITDTTLIKDKEWMEITRAYKVTSFDSGYYAIPPFQFEYLLPGDSIPEVAETGAMLLEVKTVPVDLAENIKDIKDPLAAPFTFREALPWIIGLVLLLAAVYLIYYFLKKRKKAEPLLGFVRESRVPPHVAAMEALEQLKRKKLWQNSKYKEYYSELTEIGRLYIERQFGLPALESTTGDIVRDISNTGVNESARYKLEETLVLADLVKFAKEEPAPLENDKCLNNIVDFIRESHHLGMAAQSNDEDAGRGNGDGTGEYPGKSINEKIKSNQQPNKDAE